MGIEDIFTWIVLNKVTIIGTYCAIVTLGTWIVKLTPTLKDDTFMKKVIKFTGKYVAVNRK